MDEMFVENYFTKYTENESLKVCHHEEMNGPGRSLDPHFSFVLNSCCIKQVSKTQACPRVKLEYS